MMDKSSECALTAIGEATSKSCERCRRRKIKCDRRQPCSRCFKAKVQCHRAGSGEKQRPVPRSYVQALEGQVASLELFIQKLAAANLVERDKMLSELKHDSTSTVAPIQEEMAPETGTAEAKVILARARAGELRKSRISNSSQFYGPTSLVQMRMKTQVNEASEAIESTFVNVISENATDMVDVPIEGASPQSGLFPYAPHDEIPQLLMSTFFKEQYPYNMCLYREFFLRDYDTGSGPYYSDLLFYAICATGAIASEDPLRRSLSATFANQAQSLLYSSLDRPTLTTLQALILLGYLEIGQGRSSKGWLFCGMAFRLAHEMGLHLDPNNWQGANDSQIDMEIRRRVYWAAFAADKQLSLYFGRPPALYPHESDVRNTIRIPYPSDWEGLLDTYIAKGTSSTAYEDGIALVGTFIYRVELSKIIHAMITELFENRRKHADAAVLANTARQIHVSLTKWLSDLPGKVNWNQWTVGQVPAYILHLHMLFHTTMIILHRPPRHLLESPSNATLGEIEICNESLRALLKLMKTYSRYYRFRNLPIDFVHTLSTAAGILLMQRALDQSHQEGDTSKSLDMVLSVIDEIKYTWPCATELYASILQELQLNSNAEPSQALADDDFALNTFEPLGALWGDMPQLDHENFMVELGPLMTDEFLRGQFSWDEDFIE
ncbi:hypothetical protein IQ07DRAFT_573374 [Pyrenochaeta sp. DS3sAY3a]|nr:hypothetical protein IQ07DRAFT_573374 [Pyrenochaeta sp. DS3sAY3a]